MLLPVYEIVHGYSWVLASLPSPMNDCVLQKGKNHVCINASVKEGLFIEV